jgi:transmembrane sensor
MSLNGRAEDIEAAAAAWFERREWSGWGDDDDKALQAWLSESTAHRVAFVRLEAAWERAERLKALGAGLPPGRVPVRNSFGLPMENTPPPPGEVSTSVSGDDRHSQGWSNPFKWAVGVASLAAVLALIVWHQSPARWQPYATALGAIATVTLADGSRITLDSNTRLRVALDKDRRLIRLEQGQAMFEVARDPARPLIVEVADKRVTAIGTEFSVRRDLDEIAVLVKQGRVRIAGDRPLAGGQAAELEAGSEASTHRGEISIERMSPGEVDRALSWREGFLEFQETPLPQVVAELNRYRAQKIELDDPRIRSIKIGGRFRCADTDAFLTLLEQGFPVVASRDGDHVTLRQR